MTPHHQWFTSHGAKRTNQVHLGNDFACAIKGVGNIKLKFKQGATFAIKNFCHVPKLTKFFIAMAQLDDQGTIVCMMTTLGALPSWRTTMGSMVLARGAKLGTLSMLQVTDVVLFVTK